MSLKPLVFVAMPFGIKEGNRSSINFNSIYHNAIKKSVEDYPESLDVIRADEEVQLGFIHGPMYERLLLSEIVIADLTIANPNVFYELGIRHCAKPHSTILIYADDSRVPFDVQPLRAIPYKLVEGELTKESTEDLIEAIQKRIKTALTESLIDSPIFQLIKGFEGISLNEAEIVSFRHRLFETETTYQKLDAIEAPSKEKIEIALSEVRTIEDGITTFEVASYELLIKLLLTYRNLESWENMIRLIESYPSEVRNNIKIKEQLALALNRRNQEGDRTRAINIIEEEIEKHGKSSESLGILGRFYKDKYIEAKEKGDDRAERGALEKAMITYYSGFQEDPRDYYPGINALNLSLTRGSKESLALFNKLKPLVKFSIERHEGIDSSDYWLLATILEFNCLIEEWDKASDAADKLLTLEAVPMQRNTTLRNLKITLNLFKENDRDVEELESIIEALRI